MFSAKRKNRSFSTKAALSYRTIPHARRQESPSALVGRKIRAPLSTNEKMCYKKNKESNPERAGFMQKATIQLYKIEKRGRVY